MTDPNQATQSDILEARERAKHKMTPAFAKAIDAGELDQWGMVQRELKQMIRERNGEQEGE